MCDWAHSVIKVIQFYIFMRYFFLQKNDFSLTLIVLPPKAIDWHQNWLESWFSTFWSKECSRWNNFVINFWRKFDRRVKNYIRVRSQICVQLALQEYYLGRKHKSMLFLLPRGHLSVLPAGSRSIKVCFYLLPLGHSLPANSFDQKPGSAARGSRSLCC